jgi:hypothetical protein
VGYEHDVPVLINATKARPFVDHCMRALHISAYSFLPLDPLMMRVCVYAHNSMREYVMPTPTVILSERRYSLFSLFVCVCVLRATPRAGNTKEVQTMRGPGTYACCSSTLPGHTDTFGDAQYIQHSTRPRTGVSRIFPVQFKMVHDACKAGSVYYTVRIAIDVDVVAHNVVFFSYGRRSR